MEKKVLIIVLQFSFISSICATIGRPRGVSISMASMYQPVEGGTFTCLDESAKIPYEYVNDDYCDCNDGSDEPGTAACPNGKFHCTNAGYTPSNILSSRVNDGVCDCCDGTDEYAGRIECVNNCKELGKALREEQERVRQLQQEGFEKRKTFAEEGKRVHTEKLQRQEELEKEKETLEVTVKELETAKLEAESPETEAKDKHLKAWEAVKAEKQAKKEAERAEDAFIELDSNRDDFIDTTEIKARSEFDIDSNGEVSEEEAREHLEDKDKVDLATFASTIWAHIKDIYKKPVVGEPPPAEGETPESRGEEAIPHDEKEEDTMPDYDEETKKLIEVADEARKKYDESNSKLKEIENELTSIKTYLELDFGPDREFAVLQDQCFEFTDREYTYKYCPFSKGSQRPKNGGHETSLGNWGKWDGPENDKYSVQLYDRGQNCWNGPDRSVKVHLKCGLEHRLLSSSEPSRCEYSFDFETPCRCTSVGGSATAHDEL